MRLFWEGAAMSNWNMSIVTRRQDWISLVLAILLFISPWVLGFVGEGRAAWNAWLSRVTMAITRCRRFHAPNNTGLWRSPN